MSSTFGLFLKRRLKTSTKNKDFNLIILSTISTMLLLLIPNSVVFGQTNPWDLFQQLCPTGRLATGPQCQNFFTTGINTATGTCPTGSVLQNSICVPFTTTNTCPTGSVLQNSICVPFTTPVQTAPIANAGPDQTITPLLGTTVTLVGTGSFATTSGATIVSYSWVQTSGTSVTLNGANTANPTFLAPTVSTPTPLTFSLTVTDSNGAVSAPDSVTVTLNP
jgi:hypothetical protein